MEVSGSHPQEVHTPAPSESRGRIPTWVSWSWDPRDATSLASFMAFPSASLSIPVTLSTSFCSLWTLSLSSARARSPSLHLDCSSWSCTSSFFFLCSTSCFAWFRTRSSPARSAFSFSSVCLFLSRLALAWPGKHRAGKALQLWPGKRVKNLTPSLVDLPPSLPLRSGRCRDPCLSPLGRNAAVWGAHGHGETFCILFC